MNRSTSLSLSIAMAISILSASSLSGEQTDDVFSFFETFSRSTAARAQEDQTTAPVAKVSGHEAAQQLRPIKVAHVVMEPNDSLAARREAFIARVVLQLQSDTSRQMAAHITKGDIW